MLYSDTLNANVTFSGLEILSSPYTFVGSDPDMVAMQRESLSRLEYIDIMYAGYNG